MSGSATFTIVTSSSSMKIAMQLASRVHHLHSTAFEDYALFSSVVLQSRAAVLTLHPLALSRDGGTLEHCAVHGARFSHGGNSRPKVGFVLREIASRAGSCYPRSPLRSGAQRADRGREDVLGVVASLELAEPIHVRAVRENKPLGVIGSEEVRIATGKRGRAERIADRVRPALMARGLRGLAGLPGSDDLDE